MYSYYTNEDSVNPTKRTRQFIADMGNPTAPLRDLLVFKRDMGYRHPSLGDGVYLPDTRYDTSIKELRHFDRERKYNIFGKVPPSYSSSFEAAIGPGDGKKHFTYVNPYNLPIHGSMRWGGSLGPGQEPCGSNIPLGETLDNHYKDSINSMNEQTSTGVRRYLSKRGVQALANRKQRHEMLHYKLKKPHETLF